MMGITMEYWRAGSCDREYGTKWVLSMEGGDYSLFFGGVYISKRDFCEVFHMISFDKCKILDNG